MPPHSIHVFWFSPVYHTRLLALELGKALAEHLNHIPLATHSLTRSGEKVTLGPDDLAILASPVYAGRIPPLALAHFAQIGSHHSKAVLLSSYGNRAYDDALVDLVQLAHKLDMEPIAAAACIARHTIGLIYAEGRPNADDLAEVREFAQKIARKLSEDIADRLEVPGNIPTKPAVVFPLPQTVNPNCVLCGHCWEQCPAQAIAPGHPASVNKQLCICCMRCVAICPEQARIPDHSFISGIRQKLEPLCSQPRKNEFFGV